MRGSTPGIRASPAGAAPASSGAPTEQADALEAKVHALLEAAAQRIAAGDPTGAVDSAKEAARREQRLCGLLEGAGAGDQISLDLKFAVSLGLAAAYEANGQLGEALGVYNQVIRSRLFPQVGAQLSGVQGVLPGSALGEVNRHTAMQAGLTAF